LSLDAPTSRVLRPTSAFPVSPSSPHPSRREHQATRELGGGHGNAQEHIRALSWQELERLVGEGFRRLGYAMEEQGGAAPDGGIRPRPAKKWWQNHRPVANTGDPTITQP
jgi:hypothetical protein